MKEEEKDEQCLRGCIHYPDDEYCECCDRLDEKIDEEICKGCPGVTFCDHCEDFTFYDPDTGDFDDLEEEWYNKL